MKKLPQTALASIESHDARFSPIAALELRYLHEVGRARDSLPMMLAALKQGIGLELTDVSTVELAQAAMDISWTRDPFDRLIAAHAIVANAPLVTADKSILDNLHLAVWG